MKHHSHSLFSLSNNNNILNKEEATLSKKWRQQKTSYNCISSFSFLKNPASLSSPYDPTLSPFIVLSLLSSLFLVEAPMIRTGHQAHMYSSSTMMWSFGEEHDIRFVWFTLFSLDCLDLYHCYLWQLYNTRILSSF